VLLLLMAIFTAFGLLLLMTGSAAQRQAGAATVLFFGVGGLSLSIGAMRRRSEPAMRRQVTLPDGSSAEGLRLARTRVPLPFVILGAVGLATGSAVFTLGERSGRFSGPVITVVLVAVTVLFAAVAIVRIVRRPQPGDGTWFTVRGLVSRASGSIGFVPWWAVDRIALSTPGGRPSMRLHVRDASAVVTRNSIPLIDSEVQRSVTRSTYAVALTNTVADPMAVVDLTTKLVEQAWNRGSDPQVLFDHPLAKGVPTIPGAVRVA
jgi:hypothetical protein